MKYKNYKNLADDIAKYSYKLPNDVDLIVGIPRSGLLAANILSLNLNLPLADLEGLLEEKILTSGSTKLQKPSKLSDIKNILILEDSCLSGRSILEAKAKLAHLKDKYKITYAAVYGLDNSTDFVDIVFEIVPSPRMFEWNFIHHIFMEDACIDIDGVLCEDPTEEQNDDGEKYIDFILNARPFLRPTRTLGTLVTNRLEKFRPQTEEWLKNAGIKYKNLEMLNLTSKEERRKMSSMGLFKGEVYKKSDAKIFVESEISQAIDINLISQKPVLCIETNEIIYDAKSYKNIGAQYTKDAIKPIKKYIKNLLVSTIGIEKTNRIKAYIKGKR